jgi:hypothetical protein
MSDTDPKPTLGGRLSALGASIQYVWEQVQRVLLLVTILSVCCAVIVLVVSFGVLHRSAPHIKLNVWQGEVEVRPDSGTGGTPSEKTDEKPEEKSVPALPSVVKQPDPAPPAPKSEEVQPRPDVVLVFDRSVTSWKNNHDLFEAARAGAGKFVSALGSQSRLTLLLLNNKPVLLPEDPTQGITADESRDRIEKIFPDGPLALYDGIDKAVDRLRATPGAPSQGSVVLLTSARVHRSGMSLDALRQKVTQPGRAVRLYPVVIQPQEPDSGDSELIRALKELAEKSGGRLQRTTPENLAATVSELAAVISKGR